MLLSSATQWDTILGCKDNLNIVVLTREIVSHQPLVLNTYNPKQFYQYCCIGGGDYFENMIMKLYLHKLSLIGKSAGLVWLNDEEIAVVLLFKEARSAMNYVVLRQIETVLQNADGRYKLYYCITSEQTYQKLNIKLL